MDGAESPGSSASSAESSGNGSIESQRPRQPSGPLDPDAYHVIQREHRPPTKASFDVLLPRPTTRRDVERIARRIRARVNATGGARRVFICYYLPGMTVGSGAWATSHFDPKLVVQVTSPIPEPASPEPASPKLGTPVPDRTLGSWIWPLMGTFSIVQKADGTYRVHYRFRDGSSVTRELLGGPREFREKEDPRERFLLRRNGSCALADAEGIFATCPPVE